ncbi:MAG: von Willebrand factor type A domain-containing protein [Vulcanimicrobiota bacterium]
MRRHFAAALLTLGLACSYPGGPRTVVYQGERYEKRPETGYRETDEQFLSTFAIDVDTASYSNARRFIEAGQRPPAEAIRLEEFLNAFDYDYPQPGADQPIALATELSVCPWAPQHQLLRVGLQARGRLEGPRRPRRLVLLLDVSGSMADPDRLPMLQQALATLVNRLGPEDRLAIVTYAGISGVNLPSTPGDRHDLILDALERLEAGGATDGGRGLRTAYQMASQHFDPLAINRVILATDGDFNAGWTERSQLLKLIEGSAQENIFLSVLGVGRGNLNDTNLEYLADHGDGDYAYLDTLERARQVLARQMDSSYETVAREVKIQVKFDPGRVSSYRLMGYENRRLADQAFDDPKADGGELGAGQSVTALYELEAKAGEGALGEIRVAYQKPNQDSSQSLVSKLPGRALAFEQSSPDQHLAAAAATFAMQLSDSKFKGDGCLEDVLMWAAASLASGHVKQRYELLKLAQASASDETSDFDIIGHDERVSVSLLSTKPFEGDDLRDKRAGIYRVQTGLPAKLLAPLNPLALRHPDLPPEFWGRAVATAHAELDFSRPKRPEGLGLFP